MDYAEKSVEVESEGSGIFHDTTSATSGESANILDKMRIIWGNVRETLGNGGEVKVLC